MNTYQYNIDTFLLFTIDSLILTIRIFAYAGFVARGPYFPTVGAGWIFIIALYLDDQQRVQRSEDVIFLNRPSAS